MATLFDQQPQKPFRKKRKRSVDKDQQKNSKFRASEYQRNFKSKPTEKNFSTQMADNLMNEFGNNFKFVTESKRYECGIDGCSYITLTGSDLKDHMKKQHHNGKSFQCFHCGERIFAQKGHKKVSFNDVLQHLELHGNNLFSCNNCDKTFTSEFDVQLHSIRQHAMCDFKYHHKNIDSSGQTTSIDDISVEFECDICHQGISTTESALEHFKCKHSNANVDLLGTQFIRRRTPRGVENVQLNKSFYIQQHMICDVCDTTIATKDGLINHHKRHSKYTKAPVIRFSPLMCFNDRDLPKVAELTKMNFNFDRHILYECAHCSGSEHFSSTNEVHEHWQEKHKEGDYGLPFRFLASPLVACIRCPCLSTFRGLRQHYDCKHPNKPFVAATAMNKNHCSLCKYIGVGIAEHFRREHADVLQYKIHNPMCLTDEMIDQLLAVNVTKKLKCTACEAVFETENLMRDHALDVHKTFGFERVEIVDNKSVQLIGKCCNAEVDQITYYEHLAGHLDQLSNYCPKCSFHSNDSFEFMTHGIEAHDIHSDACTLILKFLMEQYWNSQYCFSNGLILNKCNLLGTSIDDSQRFKEFAEALVVEKEKNYHSKC